MHQPRVLDGPDLALDIVAIIATVLAFHIVIRDVGVLEWRAARIGLVVRRSTRIVRNLIELATVQLDAARILLRRPVVISQQPLDGEAAPNVLTKAAVLPTGPGLATLRVVAVLDEAHQFIKHGLIGTHEQEPALHPGALLLVLRQHVVIASVEGRDVRNVDQRASYSVRRCDELCIHQMIACRPTDRVGAGIVHGIEQFIQRRDKQRVQIQMHGHVVLGHRVRVQLQQLAVSAAAIRLDFALQEGPFADLGWRRRVIPDQQRHAQIHLLWD
mmetsp:Transcript_7348/g.19870  ORF Transcript_7348/g.19870 Transcript_7348/m.19870 type:complete len:272 (-) Transcript_7348:652-1467(-)